MGDKITALLKKKKWTVYRLMVESGLSTGHLYALIANRYQPKRATLERICQATGVDLNYFYGP